MTVMKRLAVMALALGMGICGASAQTAYPVEKFQTPSGDEVSITLISHGSLAIDYKGMNIHIDPVASNFGKKVDYSGFGKADAILVCHEHGDHLDKNEIDALMKPDTQLYLNAKSRAQVGKGVAVANGEEFKLMAGAVTVPVKAIPAYNYTPGREQQHPKGNGNGYLLDFDGFKVYVSGDTEDIPELEELAGQGIDVAFLSTNQPFTMTPEQCVKAAKTIKPKVLIPYHLSQTDVSQIEKGLEGSGIVLKIHECMR